MKADRNRCGLVMANCPWVRRGDIVYLKIGAVSLNIVGERKAMYTLSRDGEGPIPIAALGD